MPIARLGSRTNAQTDPITFGLVPERLDNCPTVITAIGMDLQCQLDSPAAGITAMQILDLLANIVLRAGARQGGREIFRCRAGQRLRDWHLFHQRHLAGPDPAAIGASLNNQIRTASLVIPCRGNPNDLRWPKDLDIPIYALLDGGQLTVDWSVVGSTEGLPAGSNVDSASIDVWAAYEPDTSEEGRVPIPWSVRVLDTANNTPQWPTQNALAYLGMFNFDRDHSDQTQTEIPTQLHGGLNYRQIAGAWNRQQHDAGSMLTPATPEFLPYVYPSAAYSKTLDAPENVPQAVITRSSSDSQYYLMLVLEDIEAHRAEAAAHFGVEPTGAHVTRKFGAKNAATTRVTPRRAAKFGRYMPISIKR